MAERVSRKQLATLWDVSTQRIDTLVNEGKLITGEDGLIDREQADVIRASMNPARIEADRLNKELGGQGRQNPNHPLVQAKTMEAVYRARNAELDFKTKSGELIPAKTVKDEGFEIGRFIQQRLLAFPSRLSAELATLAALPQAEIEPAMRAVLTREVRSLVTDLVTSLDQVMTQFTVGTRTPT